MLHIESLEELKITKVTDWKIYFDYDGKHYMLINSEDGYENMTILYERVFNTHGTTIKLILVATKPNTMYGSDYIRYKRSATLRDIDKVYFVKKLVAEGLSDGLFEIEHRHFIEQMEWLRKMEQGIHEERAKLKEEFFTPGGRK